MSLFRKILAEYEEEERLKYELANPCKHKWSRPFLWDGQTMCGHCCKHEYRNLLETYECETTCTLCWACWPAPPGHYGRVEKPKRRRKTPNPKIRVFDENGRNRRVKYHTIKNV